MRAEYSLFGYQFLYICLVFSCVFSRFFVLVFYSYFGRKWKKRAETGQKRAKWAICEEAKENQKTRAIQSTELLEAINRITQRLSAAALVTEVAVLEIRKLRQIFLFCAETDWVIDT